jgi:pimeloyl-ACP methyl ester carboxylesterase
MAHHDRMNVIFFILLLCGVVAAYLLLGTIIRRAYRAPRHLEQGTPEALGLSYQTVELTSVNGKRLFSWYLPVEEAKQPVPAVVIMHGWGGNAEMMLPLARPLHAAGFAVLLVDARNHGRSDDDTFSSMPRFAEDMASGYEWLVRQAGIDAGRIALLGHSVGAAASLLLASRRPEVAAVVSIAAFAHPVRVMRRQMAANRIPFMPLGWLVLKYVERTIGHRFAEIAPVSTIKRIHCPVLLVHGDADSSVPVDDAELIYAAGREGKVSLMTLVGAGHDSIEQIDTHGGELVTFLRRAMSLSE